MARFELKMPKLGESVQEATITKWFIKQGDQVEEDNPLLEIATDKVDSEIPSPVDGVIKEILFEEGELVPVGEIIAFISIDGEESAEEENNDKKEEGKLDTEKEERQDKIEGKGTRFYSPLVRSIAAKENISIEELEKIKGNGAGGRLQKQDVLAYINERGGKKTLPTSKVSSKPKEGTKEQIIKVNPSILSGD